LAIDNHRCRLTPACGIEIKILEKVFTPEEADLFCDLRLTPETAEQIANRTGRPIEDLEKKLISM
jgi:electron transport complex protein RnfB